MTRTCTKCGETKPETKEFFQWSNQRNSFRPRCKDCFNDSQRKYRDGSAESREKGRWYSYRSMDKKKGRDNDIPLDVFTSLIQAPCDYCGTTEEARGLDRLDNSLGHLLSNVVPCCASCNSVRNDIFTPEQMRRFIGPAIAQARTLK